jgi:hypothetical protein
MEEIQYTDLEEREMTTLADKIKKEYHPTMKSIYPIADEMVELVHHDNELSSVYNKKTTIIGSLYKLFHTNHMTESHKKETYDKIHSCEVYIEQRLREEEHKKKKQERCSRSFSSCTIL